MVDGDTTGVCRGEWGRAAPPVRPLNERYARLVPVNSNKLAALQLVVKQRVATGDTPLGSARLDRAGAP